MQNTKNTEVKGKFSIFLRVLCVLCASVRGFLERNSAFNLLFSGLKKVNAFALKKNHDKRMNIPEEICQTHAAKQG